MCSLVLYSKWNSGSLTPDDIQDKRYPFRWVALRQIAIMIERIHDVPDISNTYANQIIAEMKTLRALNYLEMMKWYGGVPIIDRRIDLGEDLKIPRASLQEVVNFILKDCQDAIDAPEFPEDRPVPRKGVSVRVWHLLSKQKHYCMLPVRCSIRKLLI